jgi:2-polyprenyl-3-methyl-5-hydroxy-6-metoxy-1,4-benzoquinol methylase
MRDLKEIKKFWDGKHLTNSKESLSGCQFEETINSLHLTISSGDKVLEVGVGLGYVTKAISEITEVSALDVSEVALNRVKDFAKTYSAECLDELPSNYFDTIICANCIQHIPTYFLKEEMYHLIRSLKPSGILAVEFISSDLAEDTGIEIAQKYGWDTGEGCYCRTPEFLENLINQAGGKCELIYDYRANISHHITGCHIFHVTK